MKGVLFLSLVGAAIYMALVVSHDQLPTDRAGDSFTRQSSSGPPDRQLRSWGTDLSSLVSSQGALLPLRKPGAVPGPFETARSQASAGVANAAEAPTLSQSDDTSYEPIEWAKVMLAAGAHSEASVSSTTLRFYQPGAALQVISRENGWVKVTDPTSREGGWILEQYLVPIDRPTVAQTAMATTASKALSEPTQTKPVPSAKRRTRVRPAVRVPEAVALTQFDSRWERRAERRAGRGLFFFGRFAGAE
jgi:SH3 domain-containing protein